MDKPDYKSYRRMMDADEPAEAEGDVQGEEEYFTAEEIAEFLSLSLDEFHTHAGHNGLLPVCKDEVYVYPKSEVEVFLLSVGAIADDSAWN